MYIIIKKIMALFTVCCFMFSFVLSQPLLGIVERKRQTKDLKKIFDTILIPSSVGRFTEFNDSGSRQVFINIQDLHCHPEVQRNISRIIEALDKRYHLENVYIEGSSGPVDTSWLASIKDRELRKKILDSLVDEGKLTGAEYYSVSSGRTDLLIGAENRSLHTANLLRLNTISAKQEYVEKQIDQLRNDLSALKNKYYSSANKKLEKLILKHKDGTLKSGKYYGKLFKYAKKHNINSKRFLNIAKYSKTINVNETLNYDKLAKELRRFLSILKKKLPYQAYSMLASRTGNFSRPNELYLYLLKIVNEYQIDLSVNFPNLKSFFSFLETNQKIDPIELIHEEQKLINEIRLKLAKKPSEREIIFLVEFIESLNNYLSYKISVEDYEYISENLNHFSLVWSQYVGNNKIAALMPLFTTLNEYYSVNIKRNECLLNNCQLNVQKSEPTIENTAKSVTDLLNKSEIIVLVTGGFHTPGLVELIKERNISHIVITPNVTKSTEPAELAYEKILKEQAEIFGKKIKAFPNLKSDEIKFSFHDACEDYVFQDRSKLPKLTLVPKQLWQHTYKPPYLSEKYTVKAKDNNNNNTNIILRDRISFKKTSPAISEAKRIVNIVKLNFDNDSIRFCVQNISPSSSSSSNIMITHPDNNVNDNHTSCLALYTFAKQLYINPSDRTNVFPHKAVSSVVKNAVKVLSSEKINKLKTGAGRQMTNDQKIELIKNLIIEPMCTVARRALAEEKAKTEDPQIRGLDIDYITEFRRSVVYDKDNKLDPDGYAFTITIQYKDKGQATQNGPTQTIYITSTGKIGSDEQQAGTESKEKAPKPLSIKHDKYEELVAKQEALRAEGKDLTVLEKIKKFLYHPLSMAVIETLGLRAILSSAAFLDPTGISAAVSLVVVPFVFALLHSDVREQIELKTGKKVTFGFVFSLAYWRAVFSRDILLYSGFLQRYIAGLFFVGAIQFAPFGTIIAGAAHFVWNGLAMLGQKYNIPWLENLKMLSTTPKGAKRMEGDQKAQVARLSSQRLPSLLNELLETTQRFMQIYANGLKKSWEDINGPAGISIEDTNRDCGIYFVNDARIFTVSSRDPQMVFEFTQPFEKYTYAGKQRMPSIGSIYTSGDSEIIWRGINLKKTPPSRIFVMQGTDDTIRRIKEDFAREGINIEVLLFDQSEIKKGAIYHTRLASFSEMTAKFNMIMSNKEEGLRHGLAIIIEGVLAPIFSELSGGKVTAVPSRIIRPIVTAIAELSPEEARGLVNKTLKQINNVLEKEVERAQQRAQEQEKQRQLFEQSHLVERPKDALNRWSVISAEDGLRLIDHISGNYGALCPRKFAVRIDDTRFIGYSLSEDDERIDFAVLEIRDGTWHVLDDTLSEKGYWIDNANSRGYIFDARKEQDFPDGLQRLYLDEKRIDYITRSGYVVSDSPQKTVLITPSGREIDIRQLAGDALFNDIDGDYLVMQHWDTGDLWYLDVRKIEESDRKASIDRNTNTKNGKKHDKSAYITSDGKIGYGKEQKLSKDTKKSSQSADLAARAEIEGPSAIIEAEEILGQKTTHTRAQRIMDEANEILKDRGSLTQIVLDEVDDRLYFSFQQIGTESPAQRRKRIEDKLSKSSGDSIDTDKSAAQLGGDKSFLDIIKAKDKSIRFIVGNRKYELLAQDDFIDRGIFKMEGQQEKSMIWVRELSHDTMVPYPVAISTGIDIKDNETFDLGWTIVFDYKAIFKEIKRFRQEECRPGISLYSAMGIYIALGEDREYKAQIKFLFNCFDNLIKKGSVDVDDDLVEEIFSNAPQNLKSANIGLAITEFLISFIPNGYKVRFKLAHKKSLNAIKSKGLDFFATPMGKAWKRLGFSVVGKEEVIDDLPVYRLEKTEIVTSKVKWEDPTQLGDSINFTASDDPNFMGIVRQTGEIIQSTLTPRVTITNWATYNRGKSSELQKEYPDLIEEAGDGTEFRKMTKEHFPDQENLMAWKAANLRSNQIGFINFDSGAEAKKFGFSRLEGSREDTHVSVQILNGGKRAGHPVEVPIYINTAGNTLKFGIVTDELRVRLAGELKISRTDISDKEFEEKYQQIEAMAFRKIMFRLATEPEFAKEMCKHAHLPGEVYKSILYPRSINAGDNKWMQHSGLSNTLEIAGIISIQIMNVAECEELIAKENRLTYTEQRPGNENAVDSIIDNGGHVMYASDLEKPVQEQARVFLDMYRTANNSFVTGARLPFVAVTQVNPAEGIVKSVERHKEDWEGCDRLLTGVYTTGDLIDSGFLTAEMLKESDQIKAADIDVDTLINPEADYRKRMAAIARVVEYLNRHKKDIEAYEEYKSKYKKLIEKDLMLRSIKQMGFSEKNEKYMIEHIVRQGKSIQSTRPLVNADRIEEYTNLIEYNLYLQWLIYKRVMADRAYVKENIAEVKDMQRDYPITSLDDMRLKIHLLVDSIKNASNEGWPFFVIDLTKIKEINLLVERINKQRNPYARAALQQNLNKSVEPVKQMLEEFLKQFNDNRAAIPAGFVGVYLPAQLQDTEEQFWQAGINAMGTGYLGEVAHARRSNQSLRLKIRRIISSAQEFEQGIINAARAGYKLYLSDNLRDGNASNAIVCIERAGTNLGSYLRDTIKKAAKSVASSFKQRYARNRGLERIKGMRLHRNREKHMPRADSEHVLDEIKHLVTYLHENYDAPKEYKEPQISAGLGRIRKFAESFTGNTDYIRRALKGYIARAQRFLDNGDIRSASEHFHYLIEYEVGMILPVIRNDFITSKDLVCENANIGQALDINILEMIGTGLSAGKAPQDILREVSGIIQGFLHISDASDAQIDTHLKTHRHTIQKGCIDPSPGYESLAESLREFGPFTKSRYWEKILKEAGKIGDLTLHLLPLIQII